MRVCLRRDSIWPETEGEPPPSLCLSLIPPSLQRESHKYRGLVFKREVVVASKNGGIGWEGRGGCHELGSEPPRE